MARLRDIRKRFSRKWTKGNGGNGYGNGKKYLFCRKALFEELEPRVLLSAVDPVASQAVLSGFQELRNWAGNFDQFGQMAKVLPVADQGIGAALDFGKQIQDKLYAPIKTYLDAHPGDATTEGLAAALTSALGTPVQDLSTSSELKFDLSFMQKNTLNGLSVDLGTEAEQLGIDMKGTLNFEASVDWEHFEFGFDLNPALTPSNAFFFSPGTLTMGGSGKLTSADFALDLGVAAANVTGGTIDLEALLGVTFNDPNGDGKITTEELRSTALGDLITIDTPAASNSLSINLPLTVQIGSAGPLIQGSITAAVGSDTLFSSPVLDIAVNTSTPNIDLANFSNITPDDVLGMIQGLGGQLQALAPALDITGGIPYLGGVLSDAVDFTSMLSSILDKLSVPALTGQLDVPTSLEDAATFDVILNDGATSATINISPSDVGSGGVIDALNTAIANSALNGKVQAEIYQGRISLRAADPSVEKMRITIANTASNAAVSQFGFSNNQLSSPRAIFRTMQEMTALLQGVLPPGFEITYASATNSLQFDINLDGEKVLQQTFDLSNKEVDMGFATLDLSGAGSGSLTADASFDLKAGIDLRTLTSDTEVKYLNGGIGDPDHPEFGFGLRTTGDSSKPDLSFKLSDDTLFSVSLTGVNTVQDIINRIQTASGGKLEVKIDTLRSALQFNDMSGGSNPFLISFMNDSAAIVDLGLGLANSDSQQKGFIEGGSLLERLFITPGGSGITANASIGANNINLSAAMGFLEIGIRNGFLTTDGTTPAPLVIDASLGLADPTNADGLGRLYLNELTEDGAVVPKFDIPGNQVSLVLPLTFLDSGTFDIPDQFKNFSITVGFAPDWVDVSDHTKGIKGITPNVNLPAIDTQAFQDFLTSFQNLSIGQILKMIPMIADSLNKQFDIFDTKIPLVDQSVNDIIGLVTAQLDSVTGPLKDLRSNLLTILEGDVDPATLPTADSLLGILDNSTYQDALTQAGLSNQVMLSVKALKGAIYGLSGQYDALFDATPSQLIGDLTGLKEAVATIQNAANDSNIAPDVRTTLTSLYNDLDSKVGEMRAKVPSADNLVKLIFQALGFTLPDIQGGSLTINGQTIDLNQVKDWVAGVATGSTRPDGLDQAVTAYLDSAESALQDAIDNSNVISVVRGFSSLFDAAESLKDSADATIQTYLADLETNAINELLKVFPAGLVTFGFKDNSFLADLHYDVNKDIPVDAHFSLKDIAGLPSFVPLDFTTDINGEVSFGAKLDLGFGVDISDATSPEFFLLPTSGIALTAGIDIQDASVTAAIGGISIGLGPGSLTLTNQAGTGDASLGVTLNDADSDGRIYLSEIGAAITPAFDAKLSLDLPISVNNTPLLDQNNDQVDLTADLSIASLQDFDLSLPDIPQELIDAIESDLTELNIANILAGFDTFIGLLETGLGTDFMKSLPIVGGGFDEASSFIHDFRTKFYEPFADKFKQLSTATPEDLITDIQNLLYEYLGDPANGADPDALNVLNGIPASGIPVKFQDVNGDADNDGVPDGVPDGQITLIDLTDPSAELDIDLPLQFSKTLEIPFDTGLNGLGLKFDTSGLAYLTLGSTINVSLGLNKPQGVFIDTSKTNMSFQVEAGLDPSTQLSAELFFLQLDAQVNDDGIADNGMADGVHLGGEAKATFQTSGGDTKLSMPAFLTSFQGINFDAALTAEIDLHLQTSIDGNPNLPMISTDLDVDWGFDPNNGWEPPEVAFHDITLDLGGFLSGPVNELLDLLNPFIKPIKPIIDIVNTNIPVISDLSNLLGQGDVTFLSLVQLLGSGADSIESFNTVLITVTDIVNTLEQFSGSSGSVQFHFGDMDFGKDPSIDLTKADTMGQLKSADLSSLSDNFDLGTAITGDPDKVGAVNDIESSITTSFTGGASGGSFTFPIFEGVGPIFSLLTGKTADLIKWTLPELSAQFSYSQRFGPIIPPIPLFANIGGSLKLFADFALGYDTRGLQTKDFFNGFYFDDQIENGVDKPEMGLDAVFKAGASLSVAVAEAGVDGGINAGISANWHDDDHDNKVYLDELKANFDRGVLCIFDLEGKLSAFFDAYVKLGFDTFFGFVTLFEKTVNLVNVTLLDYTTSCPLVSPPKVADQTNDGIVHLNIGPRAHYRQTNATDGDETIKIYGEHYIDGQIVKTEDLNHNGKIDPEEVLASGDFDGNGQIDDDVIYVVGFGQAKLFGDDKGVTEIDGDGGAGNDFITLNPQDATVDHPGDAIVRVKANLSGGNGDDKIEGGSGNDTIDGGAGKDSLIGGPGNDSIRGGSDDDHIFGDDGDDHLYGDSGEDTVEGGTGNDYIEGNDGNDNLLGKDVKDPLGPDGNDTIKGGLGADNIAGGAGDDHLYGDNGTHSEGDADLIEGGAGSDEIFGDGGDDILFGDASGAPVADSTDGSDTIHGGDGNDTIRDDVGNNRLYGDAGDDFLVGGKGNDSIYGGTNTDTLYGGSLSDLGSDDSVNTDNDTLYGGSADDPASPSGDDYMEGGPGKDWLWGRDGNDSLIGGSSDGTGVEKYDHLYGEGGSDIILGDNGTIVDHVVTTNPDGGSGNDTIYGAMGDDTIFGGGGSDELYGDDYGQTGKDVVIGDQGSMDATTIRASHSTVAGSAGQDTITGYGGDDILIGGDAADTVSGSKGNDIIVGDNAELTFGSDITKVKSIDPASGGNDLLDGSNDDDTIIGGTGQDSIYGGVGNDIMIGDQGEIDFDAGQVKRIFTTDTASTDGGVDIISGADGNDIALGGVAGDTITGDGSDILIGDEGLLRYDVSPGESIEILPGVFENVPASVGDNDLATLDLVLSKPFAPDHVTILGGADTISGGPGTDIEIGGVAGDTMYGDDAAASSGSLDSSDILLGDNGVIYLAGGYTGTLEFQGSAVAQIKTTDAAENTGGADTMSGNAGDDVILGGVNNGGVDHLYGDQEVPTAQTIQNDGDDIILGDNGYLDFGSANTNDAVPLTLTLIHSNLDALGGKDIISGDKGNDVGMGGTGGDEMYGDDSSVHAGNQDGKDILLGDNGAIVLLPSQGAAGERLVFGKAVESIMTTDSGNATGGADTVSGNSDDDIIAGGVLGDTLYGDRFAPTGDTTAIDGNDIILGDNAGLEWLYQGDPTLADTIEKGFVFDNSLGTLDLVTTKDPALGGRDTIYGDAGKDVVFGGTDSDLIYGDDGTLDEVASSNNDLLFGDHGRLYPQHSSLPNFPSHNFFSIDTGDAQGGEGDQIYGEEGDDVLVGGQGDDRMYGGVGNDDMIGGHNVADGIDELSAPAISANGNMNDMMDGGSGDDAIAGDNATIWRKVDLTDPRFQALNGTIMYKEWNSATPYAETDPDYGAPDITGVAQDDPNGVVGRVITLLDHDAATQAMTGAHPFGNDYMVGNAGNDKMWGVLGQDVMQGDGSLDTTTIGGNISDTIVVTDSGGNTGQTLHFNVYEAASDGDDYLEGNGGADLMYGGLGQDDIIGGSSDLFGLSSPDQRPDAGDTIFGGAGDRIDRNYATSGDTLITEDSLHARDADTIMGDNADIYRLVGTNGVSSGNFLTFNYDQPGVDAFLSGYGTLKIIPRAVLRLDYVPGDITANYGDTKTDGAAHGGSDIIHGEAGDDVIHGETSHDVLYGDSQDDDIYGESGNDWISGGTGDDGVLGDDGLILTSRNSATYGEPLYGITALHSQQTNLKPNDPVDPFAINAVISTPGNIQQSIINVQNELKKTFDLVPFDSVNTPVGGESTPHVADDIIYGGLGNDSLHGGTGDDAISGAEALPLAAGNQNGHLVLFDYNHPYQSGYLVSATDTVGTQYDPNEGNILGYDLGPLAKKDGNRRFMFYDGMNADSLEKIMLGIDGDRLLDLATPLKFEYLLNFEASTGDGVVLSVSATNNVITGITYVKGTPLPTTNAEKLYEIQNIVNDGNDAVFGDNGNDWLVGGTSLDRLYGGYGDDLLNIDDNLETNGGMNDIPDGTYFNISGSKVPGADGSAFSGINLDARLMGMTIGADIAFGGGGLDALMDNTGADRMIDWVGEFNSYITPYAPFGEASVSKTQKPQLPEYLYALSASDGADPSRAFDVGTDPARNGEPSGEIGLVRQQDPQYHDQVGPPRDQQAGNLPGGHRDVMAAVYFTDPIAPFAPVSGTWAVASGMYEGTSVNSGDAMSLFNNQVQLQNYYEVLVTANLSKPTAGIKSNGYIIFDYYGPNDFKFAGINVSTNKLEIGERTQNGWIVDASANMQFVAGKNYDLTLAVNGTGATLVVNDTNAVSYTFAPRVINGVNMNLNTGDIGVATNNAKSRFDNLIIRKLTPVTVFQESEDFSSTAGILSGQVGTWSISDGRYSGTPGTDAAISTVGLVVDPSSLVQLQTDVTTSNTAGIVFDYYGPEDFKFAAISAASGELVIGHRNAYGWFNDSVVKQSLTAGSDNTLAISLIGDTVNVSLNGKQVTSYSYDRYLNIGDVGLLSKGGESSFDNMVLSGDDPNYQIGARAATLAEHLRIATVSGIGGADYGVSNQQMFVFDESNGTFLNSGAYVQGGSQDLDIAFYLTPPSGEEVAVGDGGSDWIVNI